MTNNTRADEWTGCYDQGWQNLISPASFSHPAKFSRGLIFRIIEHALEDGLIQPGSTILDPFGGVALGALPALQNGLSWIGVELESKFVELGRQNIALWNSRFSGMPRWTGQAQLLQGDSRRLAEVVAGAGLVVSSPPYAEIRMDGGKIAKEGQGGMMPYSGESVDAWRTTRDQANLGNLPPGDISAVISSPSFAGNTGGRGDASRNGIDAALFDRHSGGMKKGTGSDPANLDHLRQGDIQAVIGSPPFGSVVNHDGGPVQQQGGKLHSDYGSAPGQLGAMKGGVAVVGSPPFENSLPVGNSKAANGVDVNGNHRGGAMITDYGSTAGQIGATQGQTFWEAARLIVEQCALLLPPGGAAIWVVKNYVKGGVEVQFSEQWQALCEACGFETVHEHRAMLVKRRGSQGTLEGESVSLDTSKKSFFRRLAERKGSPPIDFETVLCMKKPA